MGLRLEASLFQFELDLKEDPLGPGVIELFDRHSGIEMLARTTRSKRTKLVVNWVVVETDVGALAILPFERPNKIECRLGFARDETLDD